MSRNSATWNERLAKHRHCRVNLTKERFFFSRDRGVFFFHRARRPAIINLSPPFLPFPASLSLFPSVFRSRRVTAIDASSDSPDPQDCRENIKATCPSLGVQLFPGAERGFSDEQRERAVWSREVHANGIRCGVPCTALAACASR